MGEVGLKSLNPPPSHHLCEVGKTRIGRNWKGQVNWNGPYKKLVLHKLFFFFFQQF